MVPSSSPKLEDFLGGGATMAGRGFFNQNAESEPDREHSLDLLHRPIRQNQEHQQILIQNSHQYYSGLVPSSIGMGTCDPQILPADDDEIPCLRNWVSRSHYAHNTLEQHIGGAALVNDGGGGGGGGSASIGGMSCGELQSLSLSMSPGSQSSSFTASGQISPTGGDGAAVETKKRGPGKLCQKQPVHRKSIDTFGQRTSQYRGVTRFHYFIIMSNHFLINDINFFYVFIYLFLVNIVDIDGLGDMKLICGIIVAKKKDKPGKEDKVRRNKNINKNKNAHFEISIFILF